MSSTIFRQYDARWGSLPYPTKNSSFAGNGCGCCSVTHLAIENPKYAKLTPKDVRKFMVQYAVSGKGTLWSGIPAGLKHYGYSDVVHIDENDPMSKAFSYIKKGYTMGIILFKAGWGGTTSKVYWTGGGHYIAFNKVKNVTSTDAYFYMKDSGGRKHDGWYSYQKSMKGKVYQMWLVKPIKVEKPKQKTKTANEKFGEAVNAYWAKMVAAKLPYRKYHEKDNGGENCIGGEGKALAYGGGISQIKKRYLRDSGSALGSDGHFNQPDKELNAIWKSHCGPDWKLITNGGSKGGSPIKRSVLDKYSPGTVVLICYDKNGKYKHIAHYAGKGHIYDFTSTKRGNGKNRRNGAFKRRYSALGVRATRAFVYTGRGKF